MPRSRTGFVSPTNSLTGVEMGSYHRSLPFVQVVVLFASVTAAPLTAQTTAYSDALIDQIRAAAKVFSGELPTGIHYVKFAEAANRRSALVAGADTNPVALSFPVFQIRYPNRWIVVDAGFDRPAWTQFYKTAPITYWPDRWDQVQAALRGADAIVLTHEDWDHAAGVERGPHVQEFASRTLLTEPQLASLLDPPAPYYIGLARDSLPPYRKIQYDVTHPVAAGVVLVRTPGHSPGSQWVYVQLASGREVLLVGDLVWNMAGLELGSQRPASTSESMKEDRQALQQQIDFVRKIVRQGNITVIASHDDSALSALVASGLLRNEFDLSRR